MVGYCGTDITLYYVFVHWIFQFILKFQLKMYALFFRYSFQPGLVSVPGHVEGPTPTRGYN